MKVIKNFLGDFLCGCLIALSIIIIFFGVVQLVFLTVGPDYKQGEYTMVYKVYYPGNPKTYTIKNEWPIGMNSYRGTNSIQKTNKTPFFKKMFGSKTVFETSAPIEVVSYTYKEK